MKHLLKVILVAVVILAFCFGLYLLSDLWDAPVLLVNLGSKTSMKGLYACGETSCNGVHGRNRLASNSLLESLVVKVRAITSRCCSGVRELKRTA